VNEYVKVSGLGEVEGKDRVSEARIWKQTFFFKQSFQVVLSKLVITKKQDPVTLLGTCIALPATIARIWQLDARDSNAL
jgi:hypothetical protein